MGAGEGEATGAADRVRLRDRDVVHQLATGWGFLGAVAAVAVPLGLGVSLDAPAAHLGLTLLGIVPAVGVPAVAAWLAAHPSTLRAQAGLVALATWGLLRVSALVTLPLHAGDASLLLANSVWSVVPVVGLVLASWALTRAGGLSWRPPPGWRERLAGLAVGVHGLAAVLPATIRAGGPGPATRGVWDEMLAGAPWGPAAALVTLLGVAALGVAIARLPAELAVAPAAIVTIHALQGVAGVLLTLAQPIFAPDLVITPHPLFAVHVAVAITALAATTWLATCARQRTHWSRLIRGVKVTRA